MVGFMKKYLKPEDPVDLIILLFILLAVVGGLVMAIYVVKFKGV